MMMMMMMMEGSDQEEVVNVCKDQLQQIIKSKGKRTKRTRPVVSSTTTTSSTGGDDEDGRNSNSDDLRGFDHPIASPTTSVDQLSDNQSSSEEEEDMANCLILLAQGGQTRSKLVPNPTEPTPPMATTTRSNYVHQCKTCNRCFPSFQALGGHRASHKIKPKVMIRNENNKGLMFVKEQFNNMNTTLSFQITNKAPVLLNRSSKSNKVHECSICGAEFSSGQALGGHMRRHRTLIINAPTKVAATTLSHVGSPDQFEDDNQLNKKPRNVLQLDLNLPAPDEDQDDQHHHREPKFSFVSSKEKLLVFSTSSLVNCHY